MFVTQQKGRSAKQIASIAMVFGLHLFVIYALVSGLARKAAHLVAPELVAEIVAPVIPPPPPDATRPPPPAKMVATPPPFVPKAEVPVRAEPPVNAIATVSNAAPDVPVVPRTAAVEAAPAAPPALPAKPIHVAGINDLNGCKPEYPRSSMEAEETGVTRVEFVVGPGGELIDAKIKRSSGSRTLDRAAVTGLSRCKFNPGKQDGKSVQSTFSVEYVWKLDN